jgi:hypothetical protein
MSVTERMRDHLIVSYEKAVAGKAAVNSDIS